jgi:hypothetical protein
MTPQEALLKPIGNPMAKPLKTPKKEANGKMVRGGKKSLQNKRARLAEAFSCQLPTCRRPFTARVQGKKQLFCSISCRVTFFKQARAIGAVLLKKALLDPEAQNYMEGLLKEVGEK